MPDEYKAVKMLKDLYKSPLLISAVIAVITLIIFLRVLSADFVMWDDDRMVYLNPNLTGLSLEHLGWIFTHADATRRYTPLAALNYSITYQLCRLNPFGYHFTPWLFHGFNAALVFLVLRILLIKGLLRHNKTNIKPSWLAFCAAVGALVWSLHPMRTETVAWVGANFYSQAMFFLLLSMLCYLWAEDADAHSQSHLRRILTSAGLFAAALLSHPIAIGFFIVFIALDVYPLGKMKGKWWASTEGRRALLEKIPFVAVGLIIAVITVIIRLKDVELKNVPLSQFGLLDRTMQAMYILAYYIWRSLYPVGLAPVYTTLVSFNPLSLPFVASAIAVIGMIILLILLRRRWPLGLTLAVCYVAMLVPVLGVFEHPHYPCDRYSLIVSTCFSVLLAAFLVNIKAKGMVRYIAFVLSIAVITTLGALSWRQSRLWNNTASLFEYTLRTLGNDSYGYDVHRRLGIFYFKQGRYTEAIKIFKEIGEMNPVQIEYPPSQQSKYAEARAYFARAMQLVPDLKNARDNPAQALVIDAQIYQTLEQFRRAIRLSPDWPALMNDFAFLMAARPELKCRDANEAIRLARQACAATDYKNPGQLDTLGVAFASAGRFDEAIETTQKALGLVDKNDKHTLQRLQKHLDLYKASKPYIETPQKDPTAK
jgi:tetratricopeptide (TPR) repeat protein